MARRFGVRELFFELRDLASTAHDAKVLLYVARFVVLQDRNPRRVVPAIFQPFEGIDQKRGNWLFPDVSNDSAHAPCFIP
jgi:hypothetical protein